MYEHAHAFEKCETAKRHRASCAAAQLNFESLRFDTSIRIDNAGARHNWQNGVLFDMQMIKTCLNQETFEYVRVRYLHRKEALLWPCLDTSRNIASNA